MPRRKWSEEERLAWSERMKSMWADPELRAMRTDANRRGARERIGRLQRLNDEKTERTYGSYAVRSFRPRGCKTPRKEYLGRIVLKEDETVILKRTGEILGRIAGHNGDVVKVTEERE